MRTGHPGPHLRQGYGAAGDVAQMQAAISERCLEQLTAVGDPSAVSAGLGRYRDAGATSPCVGPIPGSDFEATMQAGIA